jgi:hypothetical protein
VQYGAPRRNTKSRLLKLDPGAGETSIVGKDLSPCQSGWNTDTNSADEHSLLITCFDNHSIWDTWDIPTRRDVEIVNAATLEPTAMIHLPKHAVAAFTLWHGDRKAVVAVLEDGERLKLYYLPDEDSAKK